MTRVQLADVLQVLRRGAACLETRVSAGSIPFAATGLSASCCRWQSAAARSPASGRATHSSCGAICSMPRKTAATPERAARRTTAPRRLRASCTAPASRPSQRGPAPIASQAISAGCRSCRCYSWRPSPRIDPPRTSSDARGGLRSGQDSRQNADDQRRIHLRVAGDVLGAIVRRFLRNGDVMRVTLPHTG